jgi:Domain of unknown function (DUF6089)
MIYNRSVFIFLTLFLFCVFPTANIHAQYYKQQNEYWKNQRNEICFGLGTSNFLGELGGRNKIGSNFIWDYEISQNRPCLRFDYRYRTSRTTVAKVSVNYGILAGNDKLTKEPFRQNRNLHFKSNIVEFSAQFELTMATSKAKHKYSLPGVKQGGKGGSFYGFAGAGIGFFNPKANVDGEWIPLQPIGTEGQFLSGGPAPYKKYSIVLPMGFGYRKTLDGNWSVSIELSYRKTFSDYIDDVSGVYFDNALILEKQGKTDAYLADPSFGFVELEDNRVVINPEQTFTGAQRGDSSDLDSYMFLNVNAFYKIDKKRYKRGNGRVVRKRTSKIVF